MEWLWQIIEMWGVVVFAMGWWPCGGCGIRCITCDSGTTPEQIEVVLSGIIQENCIDTGSGADCAAHNGTYICDGADDTCRWVAPANGYCNMNQVRVATTENAFPPDGSMFVTVDLESEDQVSPSITWSATVSGYDCEFNSQNIPYSTDSNACDGSSSTCTISAV